MSVPSTLDLCSWMIQRRRGWYMVTSAGLMIWSFKSNLASHPLTIRYVILMNVIAHVPVISYNWTAGLVFDMQLEHLSKTKCIAIPAFVSTVLAGMSRPADRQPSTASRLRSKEVAALQRALECERAATRAAQERCRELQQTLDSERSAGRAWRREVATQVRAARQEEADKYAALLDNFKTRWLTRESEA